MEDSNFNDWKVQWKFEVDDEVLEYKIIGEILQADFSNEAETCPYFFQLPFAFILSI